MARERRRGKTSVWEKRERNDVRGRRGGGAVAEEEEEEGKESSKKNNKSKNKQKVSVNKEGRNTGER